MIDLEETGNIVSRRDRDETGPNLRDTRRDTRRDRDKKKFRDMQILCTHRSQNCSNCV
jgi:hypothetical protein